MYVRISYNTVVSAETNHSAAGILVHASWSLGLNFGTTIMALN